VRSADQEDGVKVDTFKVVLNWQKAFSALLFGDHLGSG
jgi:hypothetical protein